jgi:hypothetical protein
MIRHLRSFVVSSALLHLAYKTRRRDGQYIPSAPSRGRLAVRRSVVADEVWWCELRDELRELGSGGCAHTRACPVNVALNSTY